MKKLVILILLLIIISGCKGNRPDVIPPDNKLEDNVIEDDVENIPDGYTSIYVSPEENGDFTKQNPGNLIKGIENLKNKEVLFLMPGTYYLDSAIRLNKKFLDNAIIKPLNGDVILDFGYDYTIFHPITNEVNSESRMGIIVSGNNYIIEGIRIKNAASCGLKVSGNYNIIDNCIFERNGNSGLLLEGNVSSLSSMWPKNNLIKNCTSYGNYDWNRETDKGEDADGFAPKIAVGKGNVFDGCVSYNNSDDGYDLFTKQNSGPISPVKLINCIAFNNGYGFNGEVLKNGNGFKLGGRAIEVDHYLENCLSFNNLNDGFTDNSNPGTITFKNCTAYNNRRNFNTGRYLEENNNYNSTWVENGVTYGPILNIKKSHNEYMNVISYNSLKPDTYSGIAENSIFYNNNFYRFDLLAQCNSKYKIGSLINFSDMFESTDYSIFNDLENVHKNIRNKDNSIYLDKFLKVNNNIKNLYGNIGCKFY